MEMVDSAIGEKIEDRKPDLYIVSCGKEETDKAIELAERLRDKNVFVERDLNERSFNSQMKYADKVRAKRLIVIGESELKTGLLKIKNMATGEEVESKLDVEEILENLK